MDSFQFELALTENYFLHLKHARKNIILNARRCWFDPNTVIDKTIHITIGSDTVSIAYNAKKDSIHDSCTYAEVSALIETQDGIFLRIEHKGFLFLPVSDHGTDNENLIDILCYLSKRCKYVHKYGNLSLPGVPLFKRLLFRIRPNQGFYLNPKGPLLFLIPFLLLGLFVGTVFCSMTFQRHEIAREDAVSITATYLECDPNIRKHRIQYVDLEFSDTEEHTIDGCCASESLVAQLQALPAGVKMRLLIHPVSNDVLEIEVNGEYLLEFSTSLTNLRRESIGFYVLGLLMYSACIAMAVKYFRKKR